MKYYRSPAVGIDEQIQRIVDELHDALLNYWGIPEEEYDCYPRVHKVPSESGVGYEPAWYTTGGNYKLAAPDDTKAAVSFFGLGDETEWSVSSNIAQVHIIFFVQLHKVNPKIGDVRTDLEAREIVQAVLENCGGFGFEGLKTITGVQRVWEGYNIGRTNINQTSVQTKRGEELTDMHPFHVFRINGTIRYSKPQLL